jgi:acetolactate synthase-1/2/3 large subunit
MSPNISNALIDQLGAAPILELPSVNRIGGHIVVDQLVIQGVTHAFGVPGESYLAVLDGLYTQQAAIQFVVCRHEGGAAVMAEAYAKLTGRTGVCMVTRGPGATNASIGVHTAMQDSTPMILLIGQVGSDFKDREAFQEVDYTAMFGPLCKWVAQIDRADRIPEYMARAFQVAQSGRPGPVVLALPEDMLTTQVAVANARPVRPVLSYASNTQMNQVQSLLQMARKPLLILGGFGWDRSTSQALAAWATQCHIPITCAFRFQDLIDHREPCYAGDVGIAINPALAQRVHEADLIIALGPRLGEMTTSGYSLLEVPRPKQTLVHVHAGADELGTVYHTDYLINAQPAAFARELSKLNCNALSSEAHQLRFQRFENARSDYIHWQKEPQFLRDLPNGSQPHPMNLWQVMQICAKHLPPDTIVTNGAGNFATWAHRFWRYGGIRTQLAPTSGAMGYGVPAGIAASIIEPLRSVLTVAGDGDFQMTSQELATAVQLSLIHI